MAEDEDVRTKALRYYKIMAIFMGVLGVGLLTCGTFATVNSEIAIGPAQVGGYIVGVLASISALMCTCVVMNARETRRGVIKKALWCAMLGEICTSMFMLLLGFYGTVFACFDVALDYVEMSPLGKHLAVANLVGCMLGVTSPIASLCFAFKYGKHLSVLAGPGCNNRIEVINTNNTTAPIGATHTPPSVFQTQPANNTQVNQLQAQNQLLQQQLELQRQLNQRQEQQLNQQQQQLNQQRRQQQQQLYQQRQQQQQQQRQQQQQLNQQRQHHQQQQHGGGFSYPGYPPPPPMYSPPPSYQDVN